MNKLKLLKGIKKVETIASASRFKRMLMHPFKYFNAIFFREYTYKKNKQSKEVLAKTFFNSKMHVLLPSSTDIYLTGGKSHISEIKLAKFLINNLNVNDVFIDVGAHYGYFSLLGSQLIGKGGKVIAFEASPTTFKILEKNKKSIGNLNVVNKAVSDSKGSLTFYEFPNLFSEYNTLDVEQFKDESWYSEYQPMELKVKSEILDEFLKQREICPKIIKIDVEGAEFKVISGMKKYLINHSPLIAMEYLSTQRGNEEHIKAEQLLERLNYKAHIVDKEGNLKKVDNVSDYLKKNELESDNIVFVKNEFLL